MLVTSMAIMLEIYNTII